MQGNVFSSHYLEPLLYNSVSAPGQVQLLVFSVTPFKKDQNKKKSKPFNRLTSESGNRKKVDIQRLSPRFRPQQFFLWKICGKTFPPNLQGFVWRRHVGAHLHGHQHGGRKPAETSVTEFCYKNANLSLEEFKNATIILYSNTRTVQIAEFSEISHLFFKPTSQLSRPSCKCHVTQKLRDLSVVYH